MMSDGCYGAGDAPTCSTVLDGVFTKGIHAVLVQFAERAASEIYNFQAGAVPPSVRRRPAPQLSQPCGLLASHIAE